MMAAHLAITLPPPREDGTPTPQRPERVGVCVPAPGGAWAIVLDTSGPPGESGPIVRWVVRWRGDDGATAAFAPVLSSVSDGVNPEGRNLASTGTVTFDAPRTADLDGDGRMEIYVGAVHEANEGVYSAARAFYALRDGAVVAVALPALGGAALQGVEDIDHDGRVDLLTYGPYEGEDTSSCSGFPDRVTGPLMAVHRLADGGWSATDEVARTSAMRACPRAPTALANANDVACARLWGWEAARTRRAIRCRALRPNESNCGAAPPPDFYGDYDVRAAWASATPPLTLVAPATTAAR
jgi:hypothetical protein